MYQTLVGVQIGDTYQIELGFGMLVFDEGCKPENPAKNPRSRGENQPLRHPCSPLHE